MYYGKLPDGITQVMHLKPGDVVQLLNGDWRVESVGYGAGIMALEISRGDERRRHGVDPDMLVRVVSPALKGTP